MPQNSNQKIERHYFELFRRIYPLPDGQVKYGDKPDVIIDGPKRVGIEVTSFFLKKGELTESEQNQRKIRKDVLKKAHRRYMDEGGKYEISFSFNKEHPIQKGQKLLPKIVEMIRKIEASRTGGISKCFLEDIPELDYVYINPNLYSDPQWRNVQGHTYKGDTMSVTNLEQILRDKEKKAKKYKKCDSFWLFVVIDSFDRAQEQEIPSEQVKLSSDVYEKIIIYITAPEQVLVLKG